MSEDQSESIKHRLRKRKEGGLQSNVCIPDITQETGETHTVAPELFNNLEIIDTVFDPNNILINLTDVPGSSINNSAISLDMFGLPDSEKGEPSKDQNLASKMKDVSKDPHWFSINDNEDSFLEHNTGDQQKAKALMHRARRKSYKNVSNTKDETTQTELEILEAKNHELQEKEEKLREKVERSKSMYIDAIKKGKIKFS